MTSGRIVLPFILLAAAAALLPLRPSHGDALRDIENEFEKAIRKVSPATVVVLPGGVDEKSVFRMGGSSGVIVSRKGLVLSDGDAGVYWTRAAEQPPVRHDSDEVEVRLPDLRGRGFREYYGKVLVRNRDLDTSLIQLDDVPSSLPFVSVGNSDQLQVGDFAFAMGNSFGLAAEAPPTLTAGLVASLVPHDEVGAGSFAWIYTSAAVNQGVNGGPLVDVEGRLVGTISGPVPPVDPTTGKSDNQPYQFLGKVVPIERLKGFYATVSGAQAMFDDASGDRVRSRKTAILETVFHHTGQRAYRALVSLEIERTSPFQQMPIISRGRVANIWRYAGPVSGIMISQDGHIVTSLYNLGNVTLLAQAARMNPVPDALKLTHWLAGIKKITAYLPDGRSAEAKILGRHEGLGIALLKVDAPTTGDGGQRAYSVDLLEPVPSEFYETGRLVLGLGNPFGAKRLPDPLLAFGVLSKQHPEDTSSVWRGQWQTDASVTDATCGGAAVDLEGRLIGMLHIWNPGDHGRNSGIGFIVPWTQIEPVLDALKAGRVFGLPRVGVTWTTKDDAVEITAVPPDGPAHAAGLAVGDRVLRIDGVPVDSVEDAVNQVAPHWSGDKITFTVRRGDEQIDVEITLGERS